MTGYGQVEKVDSNGTKYTEVYATFRGTQGPNAGETLYAYNLDDKSIYGSSKSRTVKVWIYRDKTIQHRGSEPAPLDAGFRKGSEYGCTNCGSKCFPCEILGL